MEHLTAQAESTTPASSQPSPSNVEVKKEEKVYTTIDWFLADVSQAKVELTDELTEILTKNAIEFLMAGGQISWERWAVLGEASRAAFIEAAAALKIRSALETK